MFTWGTVIPWAPRSKVRYIVAGSFWWTLTIGVIFQRSQALVKSGMLLKSTGPCSPSSHMASNPKGPKCSIKSPFRGPIGTDTIFPSFKLFFALFCLKVKIFFLYLVSLLVKTICLYQQHCGVPYYREIVLHFRLRFGISFRIGFRHLLQQYGESL